MDYQMNERVSVKTFNGDRTGVISEVLGSGYYGITPDDGSDVVYTQDVFITALPAEQQYQAPVQEVAQVTQQDSLAAAQDGGEICPDDDDDDDDDDDWEQVDLDETEDLECDNCMTDLYLEECYRNTLTGQVLCASCYEQAPDYSSEVEDATAHETSNMQLEEAEKHSYNWNQLEPHETVNLTCAYCGCEIDGVESYRNAITGRVLCADCFYEELDIPAYDDDEDNEDNEDNEQKLTDADVPKDSDAAENTCNDGDDKNDRAPVEVECGGNGMDLNEMYGEDWYYTRDFDWRAVYNGYAVRVEGINSNRTVNLRNIHNDAQCWIGVRIFDLEEYKV